MVTNYPQRLTATTTAAELDRQGGETLAARTMSRIGQWLCGLRGHDSVLHFEGKRVMMRCTSCGFDSPGWEISGHGPQQRFQGDRRRHRLEPHRRFVLRKTA